MTNVSNHRMKTSRGEHERLTGFAEIK